MKEIKYFNIKDGEYAFLNTKDNVKVEVLSATGKWQQYQSTFPEYPAVLVTPFKQTFDSQLHLEMFLSKELLRDGFYAITHYGSNEKAINSLYLNKAEIVVSFGVAYSQLSFLADKQKHNVQNTSLPDWLKTNSKMYRIGT